MNKVTVQHAKHFVIEHRHKRHIWILRLGIPFTLEQMDAPTFSRPMDNIIPAFGPQPVIVDAMFERVDGNG
jgi:hypothetical protein